MPADGRWDLTRRLKGLMKHVFFSTYFGKFLNITFRENPLRESRVVP